MRLLGRYAALCVVVGVLAAGVLAGCGGSSSRTYPMNVQTLFTRGCLSKDPGGYAYCRCTLQAIEKSTGLQSYEAADVAIYEGDKSYPRWLVAAAAQCAPDDGAA